MVQLVRNFIVISLFLCFCAHSTLSATYHFGPCPELIPDNDFNMNEFLGIWYAIEETSTSSCVVYNIKPGEKRGEYLIEHLSQDYGMTLTQLKYDSSYTGTLTVPDPDTPALMDLRYPMNLIREQFTVFMINHTEFAGVVSCKEMPYFHKRTASLLSRTHKLDEEAAKEMRIQLMLAVVDPDQLNIVSHAKCPQLNDREKEYTIQVTPETFSAENVLNLASGIFQSASNFVVGGAQKVYQSFKSKEEKEEYNINIGPIVSLTKQTGEKIGSIFGSAFGAAKSTYDSVANNKEVKKTVDNTVDKVGSFFGFAYKSAEEVYERKDEYMETVKKVGQSTGETLKTGFNFAMDATANMFNKLTGKKKMEL